MLDVVDLFKEQNTRDELGIGTIRDAIADLLFPVVATNGTPFRRVKRENNRSLAEVA